jgi:hypothetical protein
VAAAAARVGLDIRGLAFSVKDPGESAVAAREFDRWRAFLYNSTSTGLQGEEALRKEPDGTYSASLLQCCLALLRRAVVRTARFRRRVFLVILTFSCVNTLIPLVSLARERTRISSPWSAVFYLSVTVVNLLFFTIDFSFLAVMVGDAAFRAAEARVLRDMLRVTDTDFSRITYHLGPGKRARHTGSHRVLLRAMLSDKAPTGDGGRLFAADSLSDQEWGPEGDKGGGGGGEGGEEGGGDLKESRLPRLSVGASLGKNLLSWSYQRLLLKHFGDRVRFRLDIALTTAITLVLVLMAILLTLCVTRRNMPRAGSDSSTPDPFSIRSPVVQQTWLAVLAIDFCVLSVVAQGAKVGAHQPECCLPLGGSKTL